MMNFAKKIPFQFPIGIELTFVVDPKKWGKYKRIPADCDQIDYETIANYMRMFSRIPQKIVCRIGEDVGVVEIPTRVLKSWEEVIETYNLIAGEAARFGLIPRVDWEGGGDGHIHVSGATHKERMWLYRDWMDRPYLNWAFIHPCDDDNAETYLHWLKHFFNSRSGATWRPDPKGKEMRQVCGILPPEESAKQNGRTIGYFNQRGNWVYPKMLSSSEKMPDSFNTQHVPCSKMAGICWRGEKKTDEWRLFWTPNDLQEQLSHVALVQAYMGYARKMVAKGDWPKFAINSASDAEERLKYWKDLKKSQRAFGDFLEMIGLDPADYKENFARMKERFTDYPRNLF